MPLSQVPSLGSRRTRVRCADLLDLVAARALGDLVLEVAARVKLVEQQHALGRLEGGFTIVTRAIRPSIITHMGEAENATQPLASSH